MSESKTVNTIITNSLTSEEHEHIILKRKTIKHKKLDCYNIDQNNKQCPICISEISDKSIILACKHAFCADCLTAWMKKNNKNTCPSCRVAPKLYFTTDENGGITNMISKEQDEKNTKPTDCEKCKQPIFIIKESLKCELCTRSYHKKEPCIYGFNKSEYKNMAFICHVCYNLSFSEFSYVCETCKNYTSKTKANYERHKAACKKFICTTCNRNFFNEKMYLRHEKHHDKENKKINKVNKINEKMKELYENAENNQIEEENNDI